MNKSTIVFVINDDVRAVKATYEDGGTASIFKTFDPDIAVDDYVVVETGTRWGMTVCRVTEVDVDVDLDSGAEMGWIVQKVDKPAHDDVLKQEAAAIDAVNAAEKARKRRELRESLFKDEQEKMAALQLTSIKSDEAVTE